MGLLGSLADRFDEATDDTLHPVQWGERKLNRHYWSKQREIFESVRDNRYTGVYAAHELGKSLIAADAIAWWIDSHPVGEAFVISTAPSAAQVSAILWREVAKDHRLGSLPGRILTAGYPQWKIGAELVGYGRKPADYEESAFQGIHARYVLVVIDEACGVSEHLYNAIDSIVANENSRVLAIGNPDDPGSHFATVCKPGSVYNVIQLDGLRSPNMTREKIVGADPENPRLPLTAAYMRAEGIEFSTEAIPAILREYLIDPLWIEERLRSWAGVPEDAHLNYAPDELSALVARRAAASALIEAKVRGQFPSATSSGVIPLGWVEAAMARWRDWRDNGADTSRVTNPSAHVVGVDVAYGGNDETCFAHRYGDVIERIDRHRIADTVETADLAALTLGTPQSYAVVDVIGIGAGVYDTLRRYKREGRIGATPIAFNAGGNTGRQDRLGQFRFRNDRAAAWWNFRELLDPSRGSQIALPDDERLKVELTSPKYDVQAGGIIKIESKEDIKKRIGRSTDSADSVIQAFWIAGGQQPTLPAKSTGSAPSHMRYEGSVNFESFDEDLTTGMTRSVTSGSPFSTRDPLDDWINS